MSVLHQIKDNIALISIDNPPVNATSQEIRQKLLDAVKFCEANNEIHSVVLYCKGRTFVAGADIREFGKPPVEPHLPDVLLAIENSSKPWIAALHGTALGGGLELAMACRARIASFDAKMGLPEVNLGLIPGAGGTVRLPRLVAPIKALDMIAGGKPISAIEAQEQGLIDEITKDDLLKAAIKFAKDLPKDSAPTLKRQCRANDDLPAFDRLKQKILTQKHGQISAKAAVESVERALTLNVCDALIAERKTFQDLKLSDQSKALRHIFFAERSTLSDPRCKAKALPVDKVGIIGGGTMGAGIAAACLLAGFQVTLIEIKDEAALAGQSRVFKILSKSAERGIISSFQQNEFKKNFSIGTDYQFLSDADLIIEAVFEDMSIKKSVFKNLDKIAKSEAILASNTSYLNIDEIASSVKNPMRVVGLHFFSPAHIMKLLEIILPEKISDETVATAARFAKRLKKTAVLCGVCDGFIGNRIMSAYRQEADYIVEDGASPQEVDQAMRDFGFPMGIFQMQDMAGLDISWAMRKRKAKLRDPNERYVKIADRLCELGRFGKKTNMGWYKYEDGKCLPDKLVEEIITAERELKSIAVKEFSSKEIMARILNRMQQEAQSVLDEKIAQSRDDIDVVMTSGYGFPKWRGGPMFMKFADK